ncbi:MAG: arginine--tRNA ligase [Lactobacillales bacterium]|jgi:arginyl-tRNA synthetase|nr:arginine--tRNA ligase [Lactobacillales bacterium]
MNEKLLVATAIEAALNGELAASEIEKLLETPKTSAHGDWAFPCFSLAKALRKAPQQIAQDIIANIDQTNFDDIQAVGPYLNFHLNKKQVGAATIDAILKEGGKYANTDEGANRNIVIDMSSPNIAKPFSIGHLRSTVIGDSISNLYKKQGYNTVKINHLGDWGKQFGLLTAAYRMWGDEAAVKADPIPELLKLYVRVNDEAKENPEIDQAGRDWFQRLEAGDPEAHAVWKWFRDESLEAFQKIYQALDVEFDSYNGEAFYNDKMDVVVDLLEEKHLLQESQGAQIVDLEQYKLNPALIKKSDGSTLYMTRDLAAVLYRKNTYNFDKCIYAVGAEQQIHFKQLKAVLKELGFDWADDIHHVPFGLVTKDGKKFSTRKGNIVKLEDTILEADRRALAQIDAKNPDLPNKEEVAHQVGTGAVKFFDLKSDRMNGYDFDLETMVSFEGETGPYVQYTYARINSILRKAGQVTPQAGYTPNDYSWELIKLLKGYPAVIERATRELEPSVIAKHAINLAQAFNKYYANVRILESDDELSSRLALIKAVATILEEDLRILGIKAPQEM